MCERESNSRAWVKKNERESVILALETFILLAHLLRKPCKTTLHTCNLVFSHNPEEKKNDGLHSVFP